MSGGRGSERAGAAARARAGGGAHRLPLPSGRLWPRCVPSTLTASPSPSTRTFSQTTSSCRKEGQPCELDSLRKASIVRPRGATKSGLPASGERSSVVVVWVVGSGDGDGGGAGGGGARTADGVVVGGLGVAAHLLQIVGRLPVAGVLGKVAVERADAVGSLSVGAPPQPLLDGPAGRAVLLGGHQVLGAQPRDAAHLELRRGRRLGGAGARAHAQHAGDTERGAALQQAAARHHAHRRAEREHGGERLKDLHWVLGLSREDTERQEIPLRVVVAKNAACTFCAFSSPLNRHQYQ